MMFSHQILCLDLLPQQYSDCTHQIWGFLVNVQSCTLSTDPAVLSCTKEYSNPGLHFTTIVIILIKLLVYLSSFPISSFSFFSVLVMIPSLRKNPQSLQNSRQEAVSFRALDSSNEKLVIKHSFTNYNYGLRVNRFSSKIDNQENVHSTL